MMKEIMLIYLVVIHSLFWEGIKCQETLGSSIHVNGSVSVQEGHCVFIPCTFSIHTKNSFLFSLGYWLIGSKSSQSYAATNDRYATVQKSNFHLVGNPENGDCSLAITDARKEDEGVYYFQFDEDKYTSKSSKVTFPEEVKVVVTASRTVESRTVTSRIIVWTVFSNFATLVLTVVALHRYLKKNMENSQSGNRHPNGAPVAQSSYEELTEQTDGTYEIMKTPLCGKLSSCKCF